MRTIGKVGLCAAALVVALQGAGEAQMEPKNKAVRITNKQAAPARVYINFAADSVLKPTDVPFCEVMGPLNCQFTLAANSPKDIPNPQAKYFNMALSFNAPVTCGSTKAEVLVNNPKWFYILDVSVVDGFNEKIQMNLTPTGGKLTQLGPPVGKLGNQKVFGVFPYACTICAGIKNAPCGDAGKGECKLGTESNPDVPCQYQMNAPSGLVEVVLLPK
jgi:hypothetical protein